jgi:hypothetical protein
MEDGATVWLLGGDGGGGSNRRGRRPHFLMAVGVIYWTAHGARHARLPPTGRPGWKRQSLTGGAAPK